MIFIVTHIRFGWNNWETRVRVVGVHGHWDVALSGYRTRRAAIRAARAACPWGR